MVAVALSAVALYLFILFSLWWRRKNWTRFAILAVFAVLLMRYIVKLTSGEIQWWNSLFGLAIMAYGVFLLFQPPANEWFSDETLERM